MRNHGRPATHGLRLQAEETGPQWTRTREKCAILGFTQHNYEAPWGDPDWDFKGLNDLHSTFQQFWPADKGDPFLSGQISWYQLHWRQADGNYPGARDPQHTKWLADQTITPIWMWEHDPLIPASCAFPIDEVLTKAMLPTGEPLSPEAYYNNSISWMIAHAIVQGYTTIGLFGVDMAMNGIHGESEYGHQRPSVEYFIGVARALGIRVVMPQQSELLKAAYLYGWDNKMHFRQKLLIRLEELDLSEAQAVDRYEETKRAMYQIKGALQVLKGEGLAEVLGKLKASIPPADLQAAIAGLEQDEATATVENENAKRGLYEVRGAKNNCRWSLGNYFGGEGPLQDVYRGENSLVLRTAADVAPSDGKATPTNRIALMAPLLALRDTPVKED
jgi:hypothetical protein